MTLGRWSKEEHGLQKGSIRLVVVGGARGRRPMEEVMVVSMTVGNCGGVMRISGCKAWGK